MPCTTALECSWSLLPFRDQDRALQVDRVLGAAASPATQLPECSFTDGHGPVFLRVKPTRFSIVEVSMYLSFADFVYFLLSSGAKCFSCGKYVVFITLNNESQSTGSRSSPWPFSPSLIEHCVLRTLAPSFNANVEQG